MNYKATLSFNELKETRKSLKMRQQDVADILGFCTTDRISHWEKGQAMPSLINLSRLCAIFKVCPHDLYPELFREAIAEIQEKRKLN